MSKEQINLSDALDQINSIKTDLGTALNNKGMTVTNEFASYPTAVNNATFESRVLGFPSTQNEIIIGVVGKFLEPQIYIDTVRQTTGTFGQIYITQNGVTSPAIDDMRNDLTVTVLNQPEVDTDIEQLSGINYNSSCISVTWGNSTTLVIETLAKGCAQIEITDNLTGSKYYINVVSVPFNIDSVQMEALYYGNTRDTDNEQLNILDKANLKVGETYHRINAIGKILRQDYCSNIYSTINYVNDMDPYGDGGKIIVTDLNTYPDAANQTQYARVELVTSDTNMATFNLVPADGMHDHYYDDWELTILNAGYFDITCNVYDGEDNLVWSYSFGCESHAATPTETITWSQDPFVVNATAGSQSSYFTLTGTDSNSNSITVTRDEWNYTIDPDNGVITGGTKVERFVADATNLTAGTYNYDIACEHNGEYGVAHIQVVVS